VVIIGGAEEISKVAKNIRHTYIVLLKLTALSSRQNAATVTTEEIILAIGNPLCLAKNTRTIENIKPADPPPTNRDFSKLEQLKIRTATSMKKLAWANSMRPVAIALNISSRAVL